MTFPLYDLDVALPSSFIEEMHRALQTPAPGIVLVYAGTLHHKLWVAREYLRRLAEDERATAGRTVCSVKNLSTTEELRHAIAGCEPGSLVFLDELRPNSSCVTDSIAVAARFALQGATVIATIHGTSEERTKSRLLSLWQAEGQSQSPQEKAVMANIRFIEFRAVVQTIPA